jgi:hypothetical protein
MIGDGLAVLVKLNTFPDIHIDISLLRVSKP